MSRVDGRDLVEGCGGEPLLTRGDLGKGALFEGKRAVETYLVRWAR